MKARRIASLRFLALLLALLALSSSLASVSVSAQQGGFAAAAGDFEPDIAGEPLAPLAPAVEDEGGDEGKAPAPAPAAAARKAAAAPAPAAAAAAAPKDKGGQQPKPAAAGTEGPSPLPYADLLYTLLARRATFDPRSKKLTLEGVFPIVAAVKIGKGDGRGPTSLKGEGKDRECSALVAKTARRSSATRFFGDSFKRNGERVCSSLFFWGSGGWRAGLGRERAGARARERDSSGKSSPQFSHFLLKTQPSSRDLAQLPDRPADGHRLLPHGSRARPKALRRPVSPLGVDGRFPRRADRSRNREGDRGRARDDVSLAALLRRRRRVVGLSGLELRQVARREGEQSGPSGRHPRRRRPLLEAGAPAERV